MDVRAWREAEVTAMSGLGPADFLHVGQRGLDEAVGLSAFVDAERM